ncbi:MAG: HAD-IIIC family phosphatase [bacterium]
MIDQELQENIEGKEIKCVIWDLDNTLWDGTIVEDDDVRLKPGIIDTIKELDSRGILHSIASKNNHDDGIKKLKELGIAEYFLYPEINWNAKSVSIAKIQKNLNIGIDAMMFIDDQPFERDEVKNVHEHITCVDSFEIPNLLSHKRLNPRFITIDSKRRRQMYIEEIKRKKEEEIFEGTPDKFLATLNLKFIIHEAREEDLKRAEELTVRTNQLNATGVTYTYEQLNAFRTSQNYIVLICELTDVYGSYGKIGLALIEKKQTHWHLKLLLMSCRVMARGVGTVLLNYIMNEAKKEGKKLLADFKKTSRNKMMYVSYKMANFKEIQSEDDTYILFENDLSIIQKYPPYIKLIIER